MTLRVRFLIMMTSVGHSTSSLRFFDSFSKIIFFSCNFFCFAFSSHIKSNRIDILSDSRAFMLQ